MKRVFLDPTTGRTVAHDVPTPQCTAGSVLIATQRSLVSSGTERMLVSFGQASLLRKARAQPDKVRQILTKVRTDGVLPTVDAVRSRLDRPLSLGYCSAGVVLESRSRGQGLSVGDRVASNGPHADVVCVPENLCARIPESVSDEEASFTVPGAIALQGIRLMVPTIGERIAVIGLGLIGLLAVQLLRANGCRVLGIDPNPDRLVLARRFGADVVDLDAGEDPIAGGLAFSSGMGMDGVVIAAATDSNAVVHQACQMSRKRGRLVLVGVVGLQLDRADFYEKELTFQVSCSYGPGRYDPNYEERGQDYPFGLVRWTEQRNMAAVLELMASGKLEVEPLITHRFAQTKADEAYRTLTEDAEALGIVLTYPQVSPGSDSSIKILGEVTGNSDAPSPSKRPLPRAPRVGVIGAGGFCLSVLLPGLKGTPAKLMAIASRGGASAAIAGRKFGFREATSDYTCLLDDPEIDVVFIVTQHNSHAKLVCESLKAGKHVFVEKPLAITREQLETVRDAADSSPGLHLMVGFNRRFAPLAVMSRRLLERRVEPLSVIYTVNAGAVPAEHWTQAPDVGGGRIIGEACHFVDFLQYLVGHRISDVDSRMIGSAAGLVTREDRMTITLEFDDGSVGTVHYLANGSKSFPKERIEVFSEGRVLVLDNFRELRGHGWSGFKRKRLWRQDKGHSHEIAAFIDTVRHGGEPPIALADLIGVTEATFEAVERARRNARTSRGESGQ